MDIHPDEIPAKARGIIAKLISTKNVRSYITDPKSCNPRTDPAQFVLISWSIALIDAAMWIAKGPRNLHTWREIEQEGLTDPTQSHSHSRTAEDAIHLVAEGGIDPGSSRVRDREQPAAGSSRLLQRPVADAVRDGGSAHPRRVVLAPAMEIEAPPPTVMRGGVEVVTAPNGSAETEREAAGRSLGSPSQARGGGTDGVTGTARSPASASTPTRKIV